MAFHNCADMSSRDVYDLSYEQKGMRDLRQHVLRFSVLEVQNAL